MVEWVDSVGERASQGGEHAFQGGWDSGLGQAVLLLCLADAAAWLLFDHRQVCRPQALPCICPCVCVCAARGMAHRQGVLQRMLP